jgi:hypothetical protein
VSHPSAEAHVVKRRIVPFAIGATAASIVVLVPVLAHTSLTTLWTRTVTVQSTSWTPLSIWTYYDPRAHSNLAYELQSLVRAGALILALTLALRPRVRTDVQLVAGAGALLIAVLLGLSFLNYTYASWFLPLALLALLGAGAVRHPVEPRARSAV